MKNLRGPLALVLGLAAGVASAHAHLKASTPIEGAVVSEMPSSVLLTFSESARITAVSIQKDQAPKQQLAAPMTTGEQLSVEVPTLAAGSYTLTWRVASTGQLKRRALSWDGSAADRTR